MGRESLVNRFKKSGYIKSGTKSGPGSNISSAQKSEVLNTPAASSGGRSALIEKFRKSGYIGSGSVAAKGSASQIGRTFTSNLPTQTNITDANRTINSRSTATDKLRQAAAEMYDMPTATEQEGTFDISPTVAARNAAEAKQSYVAPKTNSFADRLDKTLDAGIKGWGGSGLTTLGAIVRPVSKTASAGLIAQGNKIQTRGAEQQAAAKSGLGKIGGAIVDIGTVATQLGLDALVTHGAGTLAKEAATNGARAATAIGKTERVIGSAETIGKAGKAVDVAKTVDNATKAAGIALIGSRGFGIGYNQAKQEGADDATAYKYGLGAAAIEAGTEQLSSVSAPIKAIYGSSVTEAALKRIAPKVVEKLESSAIGQNWLVKIAMSFGGEGSEEAIADALYVPLNNAVLGHTDKFDEDFVSNAIYDFIIGGALGGILGTGEAVFNKAADVANSKYDAYVSQKTQRNSPVVENPQEAAEAPKTTAVPSMNTDAATLAPVAKTLGDSGAKAIATYYDGSVDTADYASEFVAAYNAGLNGEKQPAATNITEAQSAAAFFAGQNDAKAGNTTLQNTGAGNTITGKERLDVTELEGNVNGQGRTGQDNGTGYERDQQINRTDYTGGEGAHSRTEERADSYVQRTQREGKSRKEIKGVTYPYNDTPDNEISENVKESSEDAGGQKAAGVVGQDGRENMPVSRIGNAGAGRAHTRKEEGAKEFDERVKVGQKTQYRVNGVTHAYNETPGNEISKNAKEGSENVGAGIQEEASGTDDGRIVRDEGIEKAKAQADDIRSGASDESSNTNAAQELYSKLKVSARVDVNGIRYSVDYTPGVGYIGKVSKVSDDAAYIHNAKSLHYKTGVNPSREIVIAELAQMAENSHLLTDENGLAEDEIAAIKSYKAGDSYKINSLLLTKSDLNDYYVNLRNNIDSALEKLPIYKGKVYRNLGFDDFGGKEDMDALIAEHEIGSPVSYGAYTSSSKSTEGHPISGEYVVNLEIESITGRELSGYGNNSEQEVLFPRNTYFIPTEITMGADGHPIIRMQEVVNNGTIQQGTDGRYSKRFGEVEQGNASEGAQGKMRDVQSIPKREELGKQGIEVREIPGRNSNENPDRSGSLPGIQSRHGEVTGSAALSDKISSMLTRGKEFNSAWLFEQADKAFGGTMAEGAYTVKDAYDAMELAVNRTLIASDKVKAANGDAATARKMIASLENMLKLLPTQTKRSAEMEQFQQFSTPPNIAYIAAWCAKINRGDVVLEPSAGTGGLALWPKAWGATVYGNELSERRLAFLNQLGLDGTFNFNAEQIDNMLPEEIKPTVVVMNPPFSSTAGRMTSNSTANAERHIEQALNRLEDNGRLVAILGRGMADDSQTFRSWWNKLRENYDIKANIQIDGKNYHKYGTDFDIQLVVIDKTGPQVGRTLTGAYTDLSKIPAIMEGIRNDRTAISDTGNKETDGQLPNRVLEPGMDTRGHTDSSDRSGRLGGDGRNDDGQRTGRSVVQGRGDGRRNRGLPSEGKSGRTPVGVSESGSSGTVQRGELSGDSGQSDGNGTIELQSNRANPVNKNAVTAIEADPDNVYAAYVPKKVHIKGAKKHPAKLVESAAMAAVDPPDVTYTPNLPQSIIDRGYPSSAQLENIVYAGQAHSQILPNGTRKGYFIGDGTGVGKGIQIAGIMLDNFRQGRTRAIWISEKPSLIKDAQRDWIDVGGKDTDVVSLDKFKYGKDISLDHGIIFAGYDAIKGKQQKGGSDTRLAQIQRWLSNDFDGVIAFDEAHNMGNAVGQKGKRGKTKPSQKALAGIKLQEMFPNARIVYASATGATDVSNYAYLQRLGLWGKGTAFHDVNDFISKISNGGLAAMELVARDMKAMGVYMARGISYEDVKYDTLQHDLTPIQTEIYNTMSRAWQKVFQHIGNALTVTNADKNGNARGAAWGAFYTSQQRFYNQVLTSMSVPSLIADIKKELAENRSCVIQIVNTNEAAANRAISKAEDEGTDFEDLDMTPTESLIGFLENSFPVQAYEEYTDDKGNKLSRPVLDKDDKPVLDRQAVRQRDALVEEIKQMKVPEGPLELLFDAFGAENVAEVTGRRRRVVQKQDEDGHLRRVVEKRSKESGLADAQMFQDGKKRILIFSDAGGTGKSYHADNRAKNQQQRVHYLLQAGWNAAKAVQGFGRTHRSNEASAPIYKLVTTNIMGQKRFTSTIARRLDQLGALTKGQRQTGSGIFGEKDNLENPISQDALEQYYKVMPVDVAKKLGLYDKLYDEFGMYKPDIGTSRDVGRFLNRILSLEVDEQNNVFNGFYETFDRMMDAAIANGTVDRGLENYIADKVEVNDEKVIRTGENGAETKYVQMNAYQKTETIPYSDVEDYRQDFKGMYKLDGGSVRAVYKMSVAKTNAATGEVETQYRLQSPQKGKYSTFVQSTFDKRATAIPRGEWASSWADEMKKVPKFSETKLHMITGALLPIWDKMPTENTRVMRVVTSDGKQYLGRIIKPSEIDGVLKGFGTQRVKETYTPKQLMDKILKDGSSVALTDDRIKLSRRRVSGENRIEITGDNVWYLPRNINGIITERINYVTRYFVPTGTKGESVLAEIVKYNPVQDVVDGGNTDELKGGTVDNMEAVAYPERWTAKRTGSAEVVPKSLSEIIGNIEHDFGINITAGHIRGSSLGQYNRHSEGIRTRIANDLPSVAHELGHHLDNVYGITKSLESGIMSELTDNLDAGMKANYAKKAWKTEGLAEFLRKYLQNSETTAIDYPEFSVYFHNALSAKDNALIEQLADDVNAYYSLDAGTAQSSIRNYEDKEKSYDAFGEKLRNKSDDMYQAWIDSNHAIRAFDRAAGTNTYIYASNAAYSDAVAGAILTGSLTDSGGQYVSAGLTSALKDVNLKDKKEYAAFGEYLIVKHGPERLKEGMRIFADDRKNSTAWMEGRQAELEKEHPDFKVSSERLYDFQSEFLKAWGVGTGLVSQESADSWAERWKYYVPLNRAVGDGHTGAKRGFANQRNPIRRAHGSGLDIINPVDNIINNVVLMVNAGTRNGVMTQITYAAENNEGLAGWLEKVPMPLKVTNFNATNLKKGLTKAVDDSMMSGAMHANDASAAYDIIDNIDDIIKQYGRGKAYGDVVTVMRSGKPEYWKINDKPLLSSITNMSESKLPAFLEAYGATSRFMTSNITGNNVLWSIFSNFPRDVMTMFTFSQDKNPAHIAGGIASAYANKVKGANADPLYKEYLAMGGGKVSVYSAERNLAKGIRKRISGDKTRWLNPMEWLSFVSDTIETGPRYAYYKIMREKGATPAEAFYESTDITTNFRRHGANSKQINQMIPFFNAGVQGLDKFARWVSAEEAPKEQRAKAIRARVTTYAVVSAALAGLLYALNNRDDEDKKNYAQLSNYTKNSYWCVPIGGGKYFCIPKPREIAVLASFFEAAAEKTTGNNPHALDGFYEYATDTALPSGASELSQGDFYGLLGNFGVLGVLSNMRANKDFMGKPIVSSGTSYLEAKDQYNERTSKIAKAIGKATGESPMLIDYFFTNTLGGWWKAQKALFPVGSENTDYTLGIQGSYIKDNQYSNDIVNWLYDRADETSAHKKSNPDDIDAAIDAKLDSNMTSFYSAYNKMSKNVADTTTHRATRQTVLDMISEYRKDIDNGAKTAVEKAAEDVCRSAGSAEYLLTAMDSTVKDADGESHLLSDVQYVEYQTEYNDLYWTYVEEALPEADSDTEKVAVLKAAKSLASSTAKRNVLTRIGAPAATNKYSNVSDAHVVEFKAKLDVANDDGSITKAEVLKAIKAMKVSSSEKRALLQSYYD